MVLVAGVSSGARAADDLPFEVPHNAVVGPRAAAYVDLLADTLLPFVRERFAVRHDPPAAALVGSSCGGIVSLVAGFRRADFEASSDRVVARFEALGNRAEVQIADGAARNVAAGAARPPGVLARFLGALDAVH